MWHPPQFVRLNRILFHPGDSQLLLMLIISRSVTIYTSSTHWQQYIRSMNAEISETTEVQMAFTQRPSPVNKTPEIQTLLFVFFVHMGQFLQGGKKGRLMSFFLKVEPPSGASIRGSWGDHLGSISGVLDPFRGL